MPKTLIDIDPNLLAQVRELLGTTTKKATVHGALWEVVRRAAVREFSELAAGGIFDARLNTETVARAWL